MQSGFDAFSSNFLKSPQDLEGTMKVNNGCLHRHMDLLFLIWTGCTFLSFWMGLHLNALS